VQGSPLPRRINNRRGNLKSLPPPLPDITRENSLKILGVAFSNNLSASDHIRRVVSESAQTLYALRLLRHHGLSNVGLHAARVPDSRSVIVKVDVCINGVARVRHCVGHPAKSTPSSAAALQFLPADLPDFCEQLAEVNTKLKPSTSLLTTAGLLLYSKKNLLTQLTTLATFSSLCERTTWCVCPVSLSNSSEAQSNSSSWTQKRGFIMPCALRKSG